MPERGLPGVLASPGSWGYLVPEVRFMILGALIQDGYRLGLYATVCREWQRAIEKKIFSRLKLTSSRLADFGNMIHRNRALVRYVWLCIELREYPCLPCTEDESEREATLNRRIVDKAIWDTFKVLSKWEPTGSLLLDISIYSPSDSQHWARELQLGSDALPESDNEQGTASIGDWHHSYKLYGEACFGARYGFWKQMPKVTAVTGLLLRRQNRRQMSVLGVEGLCDRLPRLEIVSYEPWGRLAQQQQWHIHQDTARMFRSLQVPNQLRRIVLFEDPNDVYISVFEGHPVPGVYAGATHETSPALAEASLSLENLSASYIADALYFFQARKSTWVWENLASLVLTSTLLLPKGALKSGVNGTQELLLAAAAAAMKMPRLNSMELWRCWVGYAGVFRYQASDTSNSAKVTWRGNWDLSLQPRVTQAWEAVSLQRGTRSFGVSKELLDLDVPIVSQADAIQNLQFLQQVVHPVSLWQMKRELPYLERTPPYSLLPEAFAKLKRSI
ncbi:hypothetical protein QBC46DRAFT_425346 [Diplogelasinospora grovesii]|uniref:DUF6546 domain-containing protein n=1 Tax=Diplogelasinospora grovesii TaxID=303347 RepID=A0AAN6MWS8_9PEZI|nr:hypothetical protein QBC46DRAFT_425346 [Diplogelasinospora grovesii]